MKKPKTNKQLKKQLWTIFSQYIRLRDAINTTNSKEKSVCITCKGTYPIKGIGCIQAGHFIPGRGNSVLFDEDQVFTQCFVCNIRKKGQWVEYERVMINKYGKQKVEKMKINSKIPRQYKSYELEELISVYKSKLSELMSKPLVY